MDRNLIFILHYGSAEGREVILARALMLADPLEVVQHLTRIHGDGWNMIIPWVNQINGIRILQANPHLNSRWEWVYLLERPKYFIKA